MKQNNNHYIMKKAFLIICIIFLSTGSLYCQEIKKDLYMPVFALKTNALYWATTTPNLGIEFALGRKHTLDISANYNPFEFSNRKKFKHWLIQPEYRYWFCDRFYKHFIGFHGHYAEFNICDIKILGEENRRYQGNAFGGGISYGYHWILGNHWSIEATIGVGYARIEYDKYECRECGNKIKEDHKNYFGPTKAGISFIYIFK